ncbi:hypothetical protein QBC32DRAFT_385248 [Pseudoneurospora amorphoporcata]|uniref:DUF7708 domain-containing protein n=1 Tax=Pseudoneurospora amorphoporcata TaxID=241081 RepID=A0AAN6NLA6_9PEZI|nr:hypothetical protein QBC32DRAFT_385248 [Pseudoneurospora amorphoporcata]
MASTQVNMSHEAIRGLVISPMVRRFSELAAAEYPDNIPIQSANAVGTAQVNMKRTEDQERVEWWKWLDSTIGPGEDDDDVWKILEKQRRELIDSWKDVSTHFPEMGDMAPGSSWVPNLSSLRHMVSQAESAREVDKTSGFGAIRERLRNLVQALDDHKYLFEIIPKGDKYLCLFTGVVSFLSKATANYQKICDSFSMALQEIGNQLQYVRQCADISDSHNMRRRVGQVYVEIFKLLCQALGWLKSRKIRFTAALKWNFHSKHVQPFVGSIQNAIQRLRDEVDLIASKNTQIIKEDTTTLRDDTKELKDGNRFLMDIGYAILQELGRGSRNDSAETSQGKLAQMGALLGVSSVNTLSSVEAAHDHNLRAILQNAHLVNLYTPMLDSAHMARPDQEPESQSSIGQEVESIDTECENKSSTKLRSSGVSDFNPADMVEEPLMHRSDLEQHIHNLLARYLEDGRTDVARNPRDSSFTTLPSEVLIGLQKWISARRSTMVWVAGEDVAPFGSGLSVAALQLCEISKEIGIPCISFICKQRYSFSVPFSANNKPGAAARRGLDGQEAGLIALLYTVIAQLIHLLPDDPFPANPVLEKSNFEKLDGTMASAPVALQIMRELASYAPPSLIWILDNVQLTENRATRPHLKAFMDFLREQERKTNAAHQEGKMPYSKVCFTTDGNSLLLNTTTNARTERIDASRMAQRRSPGRPLRGGSDVSELAWRRR